MSSNYEGFPSVLLEAMSLGVPSISVDCESGPREIIHDRETGLLVQLDDRHLASGIRSLIEDNALRESIGKRGKTIVDRFGWDTMVEKYEQVLTGATQPKMAKGIVSGERAVSSDPTP